jgi:hypothetical protein
MRDKQGKKKKGNLQWVFELFGLLDCESLVIPGQRCPTSMSSGQILKIKSLGGRIFDL